VSRSHVEAPVSGATGQARGYSTTDIAIVGDDQVSSKTIATLREALDRLGGYRLYQLACGGLLVTGRGVAQLLSYQVADDLAAGKLVRLLQAWEAPPLPVHLVTKGRAHRAPKIDAFVEFAARRLATLPVLASHLKAKDLKGRALMIHAGGDNYSDQPQPLGGGGARIACGVVRK